MISKKMQKAINGQINNEMFSAYLYLSMSKDAVHMGFKGTGKWFFVQYQEEMVHALKFYNYLIEQGNEVELEALQKPKSGFKSLLEMFETTLKHEHFITKCIHDLMTQAVEEKDYATQGLLQWYVSEQVEEEANDNEIIGMLKMAGNSGGSMLMIDKQLGKREFKG
jgi:ferritin